MAAKLITYQLNNSARDYPILSDRIQRYPNYAKIIDRVWIVKTKHTSAQIRTELSNLINKEGKILVVDITEGEWSTYGVDRDSVQWLKDFV